MSNLNYLYRTLSDDKLPTGIKDSENIFNESTWKIGTLCHNPFLINKTDSVFQILGLIDHEIVGSETHFPIALNLDNQEYISVSGHGLSVSAKHRGLGLGTHLTDQRLDFSETKSLLLCDASQMHLPILKKLGAIVFLMPRVIMLRHSFSVIEKKMNRTIAKCAAPIVDVLLRIPSLIVNYRTRKLKKYLSIKELDIVPKDVEHIIDTDSHRFKENHSQQWFNWVKDYSLVKDSSMIKKFYGVFNGSEMVGFFMTKKRFYQQASHRGYKNVMMGSLMEWGTIDNHIVSDHELCMLALASFDKSVDAIELCCPNNESANYFKKMGLAQIGDGNVVIRYRDNSPLKNIHNLGDQSNWRLRPAMGDNSLS